MDISTLHPAIAEKITEIDFNSISDIRKQELELLSDFIQNKISSMEPVNLNFICTHNSRRSQFSQVWMKTLSATYGIPISSFSGGVEVTECNIRTIESLMRFGFQIESQGNSNPYYSISFSKDSSSLTVFSKLYDDKLNPQENFAAVMTCSHADENCPFIPGAQSRISLTYNDPKDFDDTELEAIKYDERSFQIATELSFVLSKVKL